jgi:hypothetical protein
MLLSSYSFEIHLLLCFTSDGCPNAPNTKFEIRQLGSGLENIHFKVFGWTKYRP